MSTSLPSSSSKIPNLPSNLNHLTHRRLIGVLGLLLPILIYLLAAMRPTPPLPRWELLPSISAYYYSGAVGVFVGILFALSLFLFTYPGYEHEYADRIVGFIGGLAALGVALFPTSAAPGSAALPWWNETMGIIHYVSAGLLFVCFILFSIWLFCRSKDPPSLRAPEKRMRNTVYLVCGLVMIGAVLWAASSIVTKGPIFIPEAIALEAFAISWLVKGEVEAPVVRAIRNLGAPSKR